MAALGPPRGRMKRARNLYERTDRGGLAPVRESVVEREARETWELAAEQEPYQAGEDIEAWTVRIKARAEDLRAKAQWWEDR